MKEYIVPVLALLAGYGWGYSFGLHRANKDYKAAIDLACKDYREATAIITKLRNRLRAAAFLRLKTARNTPTVEASHVDPT